MIGFIVNTFNILLALLCCTALVGAWITKHDAGDPFDCPVENSVIATVIGTAVLSIVNCFI